MGNYLLLPWCTSIISPLLGKSQRTWLSLTSSSVHPKTRGKAANELMKRSQKAEMWQRAKEDEDVGEKESNKSPSTLAVNWWRGWSDGPRAHLYPAWHQKWKCNFRNVFPLPTHTHRYSSFTLKRAHTDLSWKLRSVQSEHKYRRGLRQACYLSRCLQALHAFEHNFHLYKKVSRISEHYCGIFQTLMRILYLRIKYTTQSSLFE